MLDEHSHGSLTADRKTNATGVVITASIYNQVQAHGLFLGYGARMTAFAKKMTHRLTGVEACAGQALCCPSNDLGRTAGDAAAA